MRHPLLDPKRQFIQRAILELLSFSGPIEPRDLQRRIHSYLGGRELDCGTFYDKHRDDIAAVMRHILNTGDARLDDEMRLERTEIEPDK